MKAAPAAGTVKRHILSDGLSWPAIAILVGVFLFAGKQLWSISSRLASMDLTLQTVAERIQEDRVQHDKFNTQLTDHDRRITRIEARKEESGQ